MPAPEQRARRGGHSPLGLALAVLIPAAVAAGIVLLLARGGDKDASTAGAGELARAADARDLGRTATRRVQRVTSSEAVVEDGGKRPAPPARIAIPAAGVRTVVDSVGLRHGAIRVPGIGRAGWYDAGPRPGENGHAVIIGHLDTQRGPGLFARVPSLKRGTAIDVRDRAGKIHRYRVVGRSQVRKNRFPTDAVYGSSTRPVLVLITCGGPYVQGRGYRDNIVVFARGRPPA